MNTVYLANLLAWPIKYFALLNALIEDQVMTNLIPCKLIGIKIY